MRRASQMRICSRPRQVRIVAGTTIASTRVMPMATSAAEKGAARMAISTARCAEERHWRRQTHRPTSINGRKNERQVAQALPAMAIDLGQVGQEPVARAHALQVVLAKDRQLFAERDRLDPVGRQRLELIADRFGVEPAEAQHLHRQQRHDHQPRARCGAAAGAGGSAGPRAAAARRSPASRPGRWCSYRMLRRRTAVLDRGSAGRGSDRAGSSPGSRRRTPPSSRSRRPCASAETRPGGRPSPARRSTRA